MISNLIKYHQKIYLNHIRMLLKILLSKKIYHFNNILIILNSIYTYEHLCLLFIYFHYSAGHIIDDIIINAVINAEKFHSKESLLDDKDDFQ